MIRGGVVWLATARGVEQGLAPEVGARPRSVKQDSNEKRGIDHLHSLMQASRSNIEGQLDRHVILVHTPRIRDTVALELMPLPWR